MISSVDIVSVARCGLRVARFELRVACYEFRLTGYGLRVSGCGLRVIMVVKIKFRYPLLMTHFKFWILDSGFWFGGIATLYPHSAEVTFENLVVFRNSIL